VSGNSGAQATLMTAKLPRNAMHCQAERNRGFRWTFVRSTGHKTQYRGAEASEEPPFAGVQMTPPRKPDCMIGHEHFYSLW
jgi:hypothetical protein